MKNQKLIKKVITLILSCSMIFSVTGMGSKTVKTNAQEIMSSTEGQNSLQRNTYINNEIKADGTNGFSSLVADLVDEEVENNGANYVTDVKIKDSKAVIEYQVMEDCNIVVAAYNEKTGQMCASGVTSVKKEESEAIITFDDSKLSQYYIIKAFLLDIENNHPLGKEYVDRTYTETVQNFLAKTTDDFEEEQVLNLDKDKKTNFAVFKDDVLRISEEMDSGTYTNTLLSEDEFATKYIFGNADDELKNLSTGDIVEYTSGNKELIIKVKTISVNQNEVTIEGEQTGIDEVFSYVKIESEGGTENSTIDNSNISGDLTYLGQTDMESGKTSVKSIDITGTRAHTWSLDCGSDSDNVVKANIYFTFGVTAKIYYVDDYLDVSIADMYKLGIKGSINTEEEFEYPLGLLTVPLGASGITLQLIPTVVFGVEGEISVDATVSGTIGFGYDSVDGFQNKSKSPSLNTEFTSEGKLYIGLDLEPQLFVIHEKVANISVGATIKIESVGQLATDTENSDDMKGCSVCVDGDVNLVLEISVKMGMVNDFFDYEKTFDKINFKLADWYYSGDHDKFGWGTCPYHKYKCTISVVDKNGTAINEAKVFMTESDTATTGTDGKAVLYLPTGKNMVTAAVSEGKNSASASTTVTVEGKGVKAVIRLDKWPSSETPSPSSEPTEEPQHIMTKEEFSKKVSGETVIHYLPFDYSGDGSMEAFGITGKYSDIDQLCSNVNIYYISSDNEITKCMADTYGFFNGVISTESGYGFIVWERSANGSASSSFIFGVKNNQAYQPRISGKYMLFTQSNNKYSGLSSDFSQGFHDYIENYFSFIDNTREFEKETVFSKKTMEDSKLSMITMLNSENLSNSYSATDLLAGQEYLFIAVKNENAENLLSSDNLLYIDQQTADESGKVQFSYKLPDSVMSGIELLFGRGISSGQKYNLGDINKDGKVNLNDAKILLKGAVGIITLTDEQKKVSDINNDTKINLNDAKLLLRIAVGIA